MHGSDLHLRFKLIIFSREDELCPLDLFCRAGTFSFSPILVFSTLLVRLENSSLYWNKNSLLVKPCSQLFFYNILTLLFLNTFTFQLDLVKQSEEGDVSNYQANGEFDLVSFDPIKHVEFYSCCPEPYPDITYVIRLRRRPMFYVFNLILPCILINCIGESSSKPMIFSRNESTRQYRLSLMSTSLWPYR